MADEQIRSLQRIYTAIQHGDAQELSELVTEDMEWTLPESLPWGGTHVGHLGVAAFGESYRDHIDGIWADPDDYLVAGDTVVVLGRVRGRARSSGEEFEVPFAHVWRITRGLPSRFRSYLDTAPILAALEGRGENG